MKQLFMLRTNKRGNSIKNDGVPYYFDNKAEAKKARDHYREKGMWPECVVSYGPDHRLFKGE